MIRCGNCSAPLPAYSGHCEYCGAANNVDRESLAAERAGQLEARYPCPVCAIPMRPVPVRASAAGGEDLVVDECGTCFGHFFPFFGLEPVLADAARYGALLDSRRLDDLSRNPVAETIIAYRKCPICSKFMNRVNFGRRSGVITDQCHGHGIWLDAGELKRLVEWKNSGGEILDREWKLQARKDAEKRRQREKEKLERWKREARSGMSGPDDGY